MTDYDRTDIPAAYDRGRDHGPEVMNLWMDEIASRVQGHPVTSILDLGCGTGRFSEGLADHFGAEVAGLDPSAKMLERARAKQRDDRVRYIQGPAEAIPLPPGSVDLIFISMSLHHFTNPRRAAQECRRVLRDGGTICVRTGTRERIDTYPYVPFFPSARPLMEEVLPDAPTIRDIFASAGFHMIAAELVPQTIAPDWTAYADKIQAGADSVLARLSPQDFDAGVAALRSYAAERGAEPVVELIDLFVFR
jgi:ubiquinone/menaquinone biosynthesis C-methylase UbiE